MKQDSTEVEPEQQELILPAVVERKFNKDEWMDIGDELGDYHAIYSQFWRIGLPYFNESIPTAMVSWDKIGQTAKFSVNPDFWASLTPIQKVFITCHEMTHVLFFHGHRISKLINNPREMMIANIAMDVCVNHFLVDSLGFDRKDVDPENTACWIDTVFKEFKALPPKDKNFEYYFNILKEECEKNPQSCIFGFMPMDDHSQLKQFDGTFQEVLQEQITQTDQEQIDKNRATGKMKEQMGPEAEKIDKQDNKKAGTTAGTSCILIPKKIIIPKKKWETIIKNWSSKYLIEKEDEQWIRMNRRMAMMPKEFMLPSVNEIDEYEKCRIPVWFFQDTSGSCAHLAERFFRAAESLPEDRFIVKMHCFDTEVYETDLKSKKLYGFGGTSFSCIEKFIQQKIKEKDTVYPEAIFVITDGEGNKVVPEHPKKWRWFLSEDCRRFIPTDSYIYKLEDFE